MSRIRIAQIGTNGYSHGNDIFNTLKKQTELFEIVGYCLPEQEREKFPERMADFADYPELTLSEILEDESIEAVTVETEEIYLTKYANLAANHGKHIHMEKPGGLDLREFEALIDTVKRQGRTFHVGYMYRYNPVLEELFAQVQRGELGEIISVEAQMNCMHTPATRQWLKSFPGGMMFFLGCHLVDLILRLQGKPDKIIPLNKSAALDGVTAEDYGMAVLEYTHGISFAKASAVEVGGFPRRQLVVSGTKKTVEVQPLEFWAETGFQDGMYSEVTEYASREWCYAGEKRKSQYYDRYETMMARFADMVQNKIKNSYSLDYELELYKTLLQCCGHKCNVGVEEPI